MSLTFSRSYLSSYTSEDNRNFKDLRLYYVYKDNSLLGQYFRNGDEHFFYYPGHRSKIEIIGKLFEKKSYQLIDESNQQTIGKFEIPGSYNTSPYHYPEVPYSDPYPKLIMGENAFEFRREKQKVEYWLFDKNTWGYYNFALYDNNRDPKLSYDFRVEDPPLNAAIRKYHNLEGSIEPANADHMLLFAGFFLLENFIDRSGIS